MVPTIQSHSPLIHIHHHHHHHNKHLSAAIRRYQSLIKSQHHHHPLVLQAVNISKNVVPPLQYLLVAVVDTQIGLVHDVDESSSRATLTCKNCMGCHARSGDVLPACMGWSHASSSESSRVGFPTLSSPWSHAGHGKELLSSEGPFEDSGNHEHEQAQRATLASFPLVLPSESALAEKGAYAPHMVYSPEDVKTLDDLVLITGTHSILGIGHPDIVTCAKMFWWPAGSDWSDRFASQPGTGYLNPLNPKTYQVLKNVLNDITTLFPEPFFHSGANEVVPGCWKTDPTIQKHLSNGGTLNQVLEKYINNTLPFIVSLNHTVIYWEDVLLDDKIHVPSRILPKEHVILQTWQNGHDHTKKIVSAGYRTIVSSAEFYYLDSAHGTYVGNNSAYDNQDGGTGNGGSRCASFKTWQTIYSYDITYGLSEEEAKLVLGGEVALWSEQADPTVLDARVWPRASALAESLWSGNRDENGLKRYAEATDRLNEWRSRMVSRGIGAEPIQPLWCVQNPGM